MRMKFSIIGCQHAHIGIFIKEMLALGHECAGIHEPDNSALASSLAAQYGVPLVSDRAALLDESVGVVGCAAVNNQKIDIIELCERHGKHVMIDKPAVTDQSGMERLREVAGRGKIQLGMLLTERFRSSVVALKRMIDNGELGRVVHIQMRKPHLLSPEKRPSWHFDKRLNGGIIIDLLVHDFDLLRWLTGREIGEISGYKAKNILPEYPSFYDMASVQVIMDDGTPAHLYADWHTPAKSWTWGDCRIFVAGTEGSAEVRLEGDAFHSTDQMLIKVTNEKETEYAVLPELRSTVSDDFLLRVAGGESSITITDVLRATEASLRADQQVKLI